MGHIPKFSYKLQAKGIFHTMHCHDNGMKLLTKWTQKICNGNLNRKKDAHWRHFMAHIIRLRFNMTDKRRQWSSAASKPRCKTHVKLCIRFWTAKVPSHQI